MERAQKLIGPFLGIFLLSALPALGQELRAVGQNPLDRTDHQ